MSTLGHRDRQPGIYTDTHSYTVDTVVVQHSQNSCDLSHPLSRCTRCSTCRVRWDLKNDLPMPFTHMPFTHAPWAVCCGSEIDTFHVISELSIKFPRRPPPRLPYINGGTQFRPFHVNTSLQPVNVVDDHQHVTQYSSKHLLSCFSVFVFPAPFRNHRLDGPRTIIIAPSTHRPTTTAHAYP